MIAQKQKTQVQSIEGLTIIQNFISPFQEEILIQKIKISDWNMSLKRRTQHYGYQYSYDRKSQAKKTVEIPQWCILLKKQLQDAIKQKYSDDVNFDQMIVNQYEPGQGINAHIDNINLFRETVVSVSLGSDTVMNFEKGEKKVEIGLKRCCALLMRGQSRYKWKHSIAGRKKDNGKGRGVRYSITFREMR